MDERVLCERLITYDTSSVDGIKSAAGFVKGWLEARDIVVDTAMNNGLPVLAATVGAEKGPTVVLHGHLDVVPAEPEQFEPRLDGDRLYGRGAYDMKGGLASMMCATRDLAAQGKVKVHFVMCCDEESEEDQNRGSDYIAKEMGYLGDFAITGEPTDMLIGVQAKGVLLLRLDVRGRAAHGSTPWLGDNAVLKAMDVFRAIQSLPFARESSEMFDRPSINLGRVYGGDVPNKVPDHCVIDVDIRFLPGQEANAILDEVKAIPDTKVDIIFHRDPVVVSRTNPYVVLLAEAASGGSPAERISVGRDGASDITAWLDSGVPGVEFGPVGEGHHGPEEWVSVDSLVRYRQALVDFVNLVGERRASDAPQLRVA
ncbi:MAG TPA: M20/M25/M40 family metallo-hydrolase [Thermoleophilaceae bacterium]